MKTMNNIKRILALAALILPFQQASALESTGALTSATFAASTAEIQNPGRGMVVNGGDLAAVTSGNLATWKAAGYRIISHRTSLAAYVTTPTLPGGYLASLTAAAALHRAAGTKMILRFVYSTAQGQAEPTLAIAAGHVSQLGPFLKANADVIAFLQAGFLGVNGQWVTTSSATIGGGTTSPNATAQDAIKSAIFAVADRRTPVQFPLVTALRRWWPNPLTANQRFSGSDQSRAGLHNDFFLSDANDGATFTDPSTGLQDATLSNPLRAYADTAILNGASYSVEAFGNGRTSCASILAEGKLYQVSTLQGDASNVYVNSWTSGGCIDEVKRSVGHRFQLKRVSHQSTVNPGDSITINVEVQNLGWSVPYTQRRVRAQLVNGNTTLTCTSATDLRSIQPDSTTNYVVPIRCTIPFDTPTNSYAMYLSVPDAWQSTNSIASYSIQWANANATGQTWDATAARIGTNTSVAVGTTTNVGGQAPEPMSLTGLTNVTSRITATTGQVIEGKNITTTSGPCIVIPPGVQNVTIRGNRIGPCGTSTFNQVNGGGEGVMIQSGAGGGLGITIQRNEIRDVSTAVWAQNGSYHPIVIDRNQVWNIRGPNWQGQFVQMSTRAGTGSSKITCNVVDGDYKPGFAAGSQHIGDHISIYNVLGNGNANPLEIAYNRIIGSLPASNPERSGSGMQLGDGANGGATPESGYYYVHHNTVVTVPGTGIGVAGGHDIRVENNIIDQRAAGADTVAVLSQVGRPFTYKNWSATQGCSNISFTNNRSTLSRVWAFDNGWYCPGPNGTTIPGNPDGTPNTTYGACTQVWTPTTTIFGEGCTVSLSGNNFNDAGLAAQTRRQIFEKKYDECNSSTGTGTSGGSQYSQTTIFSSAVGPVSLYQPAAAAEVRQGQDVELDFQVFGVPLATNAKASVWLVRPDNTYGGDTNFGLVNHFDLFPAATWNGFTATHYKYRMYVPIGATADVTYKVVVNFYSAYPPYSNFFDSVGCAAGVPYINIASGTRGCHITNLTVRPHGGVPGSTVYNTLSGSSSFLTGTTWSP